MTRAPARAFATLLGAVLLGPLAAQTDWNAEVERACTHRHVALRLAAARKVAEGGDAAVPAVQAFEKQKGKDALPMTLVEAFAQRGSNGPATMALLTGWATDRDFYWRGQAMLGLALRARKDAAIAKAFDAVFQAYRDDPAWLTRTHARLGAGEINRIETDPRARSRLAALLLADGDASRVADLVEALADERTFLGDPWGRRRALEAFHALKTWLGDDFGYKPDAAWSDNRDPILRLGAAVTAKTGAASLQVPTNALQDAGGPPAGGVEILSCKLGDLFLTWGEDGTLSAGIARERNVNLPRDKFEAWAKAHAAIHGEAQQGVVICDKLRLKWDRPEPALHFVAAPGALPQATTDWLRSLAALLEENGEPRLGAALRERLQQFAAPAAR